MGNGDINNNSKDNNTNWLGFPLSPHMTMEVSSGRLNHYQTHPPSAAISTVVSVDFFHSQSHLIYHGTEGDASLYAPSSAMPLKSNRSLCMLEARDKSQPHAMVTTSTLKLENFFEGATMGTHHYESNDREAMALSLDSMFYNQMPGHEISRTCPVNQLGEQKMIGCMGDNGSESGAIGAMSCGDLHSLSLSVRSSSQSSYVIGSQLISPTELRKSLDTFGQRTSQYRGVTRHRWTGRYEAHLWDNSYKKEGQSRKGMQGGYDLEEKVARAYDLAALEYWGPSTHISFPEMILFSLCSTLYKKELDEMKNMIRQEYVAHLRRKSSEFSRGASIKRGVTRHHQHGRWQARIGWVAGSKELYLGTFSTQEEAAEAYDITAIKFRGVNAVTNFDITRYDVERIMASSTLLPGEVAKRRKQTGSNMIEALDHLPTDNSNGEASISQKNSECESEWKTADLHQETNHKPPKTESSPNRACLPMLFGLPTSSSMLLGTLTGANSWIPSTQMRPALFMPLLAAWTDA
ncbi:hypothetical protein I3843_01G001100 [Carya illinoinensis]|nr:hypothetical protein I3843_01G001100 [Carya illinoinensis]